MSAPANSMSHSDVPNPLAARWHRLVRRSLLRRRWPRRRPPAPRCSAVRPGRCAPRAQHHGAAGADAFRPPLHARRLHDDRRQPRHAAVGYVETAFTHTSKNDPAPAKHLGPNDNARVQRVKGISGGAITDNVGAFAEVVYRPVAGRLQLGNVDLRWSDSATLGSARPALRHDRQQQPGIPSPWNSTLARMWPFARTVAGPMPRATPLLDRPLAQRAFGASLYGFLDDAWYAELGGYGGIGRSAQETLGLNTDDARRIDGVALYGRLAREARLPGGSLTVRASTLFRRPRPTRWARRRHRRGAQHQHEPAVAVGTRSARDDAACRGQPRALVHRQRHRAGLRVTGVQPPRQPQGLGVVPLRQEYLGDRGLLPPHGIDRRALLRHHQRPAGHCRAAVRCLRHGPRSSPRRSGIRGCARALV